LNVPRLEKEIGIEVYATKTNGIGGRLRQVPEDFKVEEILTDGSTARIGPANIPDIIGHGRYLTCVLVKRDMDAFQAVEAIAKKLNIDNDRIQIGGIKDANALTAQHVSISRMLPEQVGQIKTRNLWLYPLRFSNEKIHSNLLFGNQFHIKIRNLNYSALTIEKHEKKTKQELLKLGGCPNFYGHQRFGTTRPITHLVGKNIVLGEWQKAALTFMAKSSRYEHPESRQARQTFRDTHDYEEALDYFPPKLVYERQMLVHLVRQRTDFIGAFHRLPKKLCQLFVQAYQSYLFNKFLSERIRRGLPLRRPLRRDHKIKMNGEDRAALPLIGYKQALSAGEQGEIERRILDEEGVEPKNFKVSGMRQISSRGGLRTALAPIIDLHIERPSEDEMNLGKKSVNLSFTLRKGSYATVVLREFMKPKNPTKAGF